MRYGQRVHSLEAFLGSMGSATSAYTRRRRISGLYDTRICLGVALRACPTSTIAWAGLPSCVPPSLPYYQAGRQDPKGGPALAARVRDGREHTGTGISTRCPSTTPLGLALGPDLPWADEPCPGTLGHPAAGFLAPLSLLMPAFALDTRPRLGSPAASPAHRRSPTTSTACTHHPEMAGGAYDGDPQLRYCA